MGDDDPTSERSDGAGDATVSLPRDALAPPPPPPDPLEMIELRRAAVPPSSPTGPAPSGGRGLIWIGVVVGLAAVFVVACYVVVARAESDRGEGPSQPPSTTQPTTTTGSTTTAAPPATHPPASLTVAVLNGTEQVGWAGDNAETLSGAGFQTETTDALASPPTTTVYVASDDLQPDAAAVAAALGLPDAPIEARPAEPLSASSIDQDVDIVVVLGADSLDG